MPDTPPPGQMTPGEAAFRVWWQYCRPSDTPGLLDALWQLQASAVRNIWERIAAAAIAAQAVQAREKEEEEPHE